VLEFDLGAAYAGAARLADFKVTWNAFENTWTRYATKTFPEDFIAWHATLPPGLKVDVSSQLAGLLGPPLRAHVEFTAAPADGAQRDWFDLTVALRVEDTTLTPAEIALLLKARGKWVSLPGTGWRRIELAEGAGGEPAAAALDRLGLGAGDVLATGKPATHKMHALQLAAEAASLESRDAKLAAALRTRVTALAALVPPEVPADLRATLRPYQREGFQFLAHLAAQGFGGVLADDMGLGKTVQTLAWLLHLATAPRIGHAPLRVLVVCPKSVTHGWLIETERFAPSLHAVAFNPLRLGPAAPGSHLLIANYTQLRLNAPWFQQQTWDAVVLDEGQFIKNPGSQVAATARSLPSRHRLVLTGTPIENRLTDLWSLFAFAQPGLLGTQTAFRRQYDESDPAALSRLHRRVRHFLLRRTKAQAAPDLPPRTEDEIVVELEGEQRKLYDAELKRARAQLLGIATDRALDAVRFNILASLLRLRQICCHPGLIDPAHRHLPSAKLDALLERLEELRDEGHQVLVFSQFVEMLEIIRVRLHSAGIGHLMLTGATENRAELVDEFQRDKTKTVFLLSLKAAGFGLNLTAASYVILYDPWWNPAVEAQAIDRTHRIGQTQPVVAYRLLAEGTVEEKIRALQKEKAALASAVVQEESLASILDLESLRQVLA
jgi:SNF2 family DNA or RNA helicase